MAPRKPMILSGNEEELDRRARLANLFVLIADRDQRTASLVHRIMYSFGFRNMDMTTNGESVLALLRARHYDIIITEWNMEPLDGLGLVKAIRSAQDDERIRRDIPIIMLTARADLNSVQAARDAGITEFVAKPFSAKTISNRIIQIIDNPRVFIDSSAFIGPDRRRREPPPDLEERRISPPEAVLPANLRLRRYLGEFNAADIIDEIAVSTAQAELLKAEDDFIDWARDDIMRLRQAFEEIGNDHNDTGARRNLVDAAYAIQAQSGIFGYQLGTEVAQLLTSYLAAREHFNDDNLLVISKYIDTMATIFKERMKESGQGIAYEMVQSLKKLTQKLG